MALSTSCPRFLPLLLVLASAGGCVSASASRESRADAVLIRVENAQFESLALYLVRADTPIRLGVVDGFQVRTFLAPAGAATASALILRAESRASLQIQVSRPFYVEPGQSVAWTLRGSANLSSLIVR